MSLLLFKILVICTSLLAWAVLSIAGVCFLQYIRYNKKTILITSITWVLCAVSFYNSWYEGLFLFRKIALIPSLNSWAFTLLTPLFYLYFCFWITNRLSNSQQWRRHLLLPGVLAGIYIGMTLFNPVPDKLIYSWSEFKLNSSAWWISFRISCYSFLAIQLFVYLPRILKGINDNSTPQIQLIKKELLYLLCFYIISIINLFTSNYICNIIYNLSIICIGGYFLKQSVICRTIKRKIGSYLLPNIFIKIETDQKEKDEIPIPQTSKKEEDEEGTVIRLLKLPKHLHNPDLTLKILASELGMNVTSLSQYFSQYIGIRFPEYVTSLRLDEAEILLMKSDIKVIEISELVGFQTSSSFYLAFNTRHHMPPLQWKKKMKANS